MKQNTVTTRVASELRARIRSGELAPGARVPSARQIVREWGVALATATKVLALLRREGLVRVQPGIGTVVRVGERGVELSRERIVQAAIAIADDEGTDALSMRTLARELGVATMSLYRHIASREELIEQMADAVLAEEKLPPATSGWRKRLEALAHQQWEGYRRHAWLAQTLSMTRPQALKNGMRHTEAVLAALEELRLEPETLLRTGVAFLAYVRGMAVSLEAEQRAEQDTGLDSDEWMATQEPTFAPMLSGLPILARLSRMPDTDMSLDALFECGLRCFLDGLATRAAS